MSIVEALISKLNQLQEQKVVLQQMLEEKTGVSASDMTLTQTLHYTYEKLQAGDFAGGTSTDQETGDTAAVSN